MARFSWARKASVLVIRSSSEEGRNEDRCAGRASSGKDYQDSCGRSSYSYNSLAGVQISALYHPFFSAPLLPLSCAFLCLHVSAQILWNQILTICSPPVEFVPVSSPTYISHFFFAICQNHNTRSKQACSHFLKVRFDVTASGRVEGWKREETV